MTTDKTLPVVAWLEYCTTQTSMKEAAPAVQPWVCGYSSGPARPADNRSFQFYWAAAADHAAASARIAELERQRQELKGNSHAVLNALSHDARELAAQVRNTRRPSPPSTQPWRRMANDDAIPRHQPRALGMALVAPAQCNPLLARQCRCVESPRRGREHLASRCRWKATAANARGMQGHGPKTWRSGVGAQGGRQC